MKRRAVLLLNLAFLPSVLALSSPIFYNSEPPTVNLGYATYQGVSNSETGNTEFLGVRYAAPPTGA